MCSSDLKTKEKGKKRNKRKANRKVKERNRDFDSHLQFPNDKIDLISIKQNIPCRVRGVRLACSERASLVVLSFYE